MPVLKADAYGAGASAMASHLARLGVDGFGVATAEEGVSLRKTGVTLPILVMRGLPEELPVMHRYQLTATVTSDDMLQGVLHLHDDESLSVHIELETGMHRSGLTEAAALEAARSLRAHPAVALEGLMTHLLGSYDPAHDSYSRQQLLRFDRVCMTLDPERSLTWHAAASSGTLRLKNAQYDMVRLGLGLLGAYPSNATKTLNLEAVVTFVTYVSHVVSVSGGAPVGYGGTYVAPRDGARVGVLPVGYYDGIPRQAGTGHGKVLVAGSPCPIIGMVAMDTTLVDLTGSSATSGSEVVIFGHRGSSNLRVEDVAEAAGTVPYEILCRVGPRVPRVYECA
jgi:alanine racemase